MVLVRCSLFVDWRFRCFGLDLRSVGLLRWISSCGCSDVACIIGDFVFVVVAFCRVGFIMLNCCCLGYFYVLVSLGLQVICGLLDIVSILWFICYYFGFILGLRFALGCFYVCYLLGLCQVGWLGCLVTF